jgi:hypothetical protein
MSTAPTRREFLLERGQSAAAVAAGSWLSRIGYTQIGRGPARAVINLARARSEHNWLDGVGPKDRRPTVLERAWNWIGRRGAGGA